MGKMGNKVSKHYRIREDIASELGSLVVLSNRVRDDAVTKDITETMIVENAIVMYIRVIKDEMRKKGML